MTAQVTLTIQGGSLDGSEYTFDKPVHCVIGREEDCALRLPNKGWEFKMVSRHHCLLDIDPFHIRVRDLGSRNGTYVNGRLIGLRPASAAAWSPGCDPARPIADTIFAGHDLQDGDVLSVGPVTFSVRVARVATAQAPSGETPTESKAPETEKRAETPADWVMLSI